MIRVMVAEDCMEQYYDCCEFLTKDKDIEVIQELLMVNLLSRSICPVNQIFYCSI